MVADMGGLGNRAGFGKPNFPGEPEIPFSKISKIMLSSRHYRCIIRQEGIVKNLSCFPVGSVINDLQSEEKFMAIHELINRAPVFRRWEDKGRFEQAVCDRERLQSTGLGHGIAMAHGKCDAVGQFVIALGISRRGIDFDSYDAEPVHFLFLVANPPEYQSEYLPVISSLAELLRNEDFRRRLLESRSPRQVEGALRRSFHRILLRRYGSLFRSQFFGKVVCLGRS